jgi:hypothetical protein
MHNYFEKNKSLLASRGFLNTELSSQLSPDIEIKPTRQNEITIKLGNLLIHSAYDPIRKAKQFADRPAILISAGPSLDGLHSYLNWLAERTLLTCVDTTFPL